MGTNQVQQKVGLVYALMQLFLCTAIIKNPELFETTGLIN